MLPRLRQARANIWIVALYALAVATLGFAHKPVAAGAAHAQTIDLAAYALPDGTLPDLCLTDHGNGPTNVSAGKCDACALSSAPGLAPPAATIAPAIAPVRLAIAIASEGQFSPEPRHGPTSRGPPSA